MHPDGETCNAMKDGKDFPGVADRLSGADSTMEASPEIHWERWESLIISESPSVPSTGTEISMPEQLLPHGRQKALLYT